jgi:hypothetical protein
MLASECRATPLVGLSHSTTRKRCAANASGTDSDRSRTSSGVSPGDTSPSATSCTVQRDRHQGSQPSAKREAAHRGLEVHGLRDAAATPATPQAVSVPHDRNTSPCCKAFKRADKSAGSARYVSCEAATRSMKPCHLERVFSSRHRARLGHPLHWSGARVARNSGTTPSAVVFPAQTSPRTSSMHASRARSRPRSARAASP